MNLEAIILAGGFGTRLTSLPKNVPKSLAEINEKPFLFYLIANLRKQGIKHIHLSLHHLSEKITEEFKNEEGLFFHKEEAPLGTGGAILHNLQFINSKNVLILNGDVLTTTKISQMFEFHLKSGSNFTISAIKVENIKRFGSLQIKNHKILKFCEKGLTGEGYINAGTYIAKTNFLLEELEKIGRKPFSIEKDFFEKSKNLMAFENNSYFIDIGTVEDYERAKFEIPNILTKTNKSFHF